MGGSDEACQAVSWLLRHGADPYIRCRWTNMAAIHYAAYFDVAAVAAILLATTKGIGRSFFRLSKVTSRSTQVGQIHAEACHFQIQIVI